MAQEYDETGQPISKDKNERPAAQVHELQEEQPSMPAMDPQEMMKMWQEMIALGEEHERLAKDVGKYTYTNTFWMQPGAEPMVSEGTTTIEPMMDGRYFKEMHEGQSMGMPFTGYGLTGYDKVAKEYVSTWMDNLGTGIMIFRGNLNAQGKLEMIAETTNPMTGQQEEHKIIRTDKKNGWQMDYIIMSGPGQEFKTMQMDFVRL